MLFVKVTAILSVLILLIAIIGCTATGSSHQMFGPVPAPTPQPSPTPMPSPTPSPTPTPTPTPNPVKTQFLYTGDSRSVTISGFNINSDGTLTALAGSPFSAGTAIPGGFNNFPTMLRTAKTTLLADGNTTFVVNPATGTVTSGKQIFDSARSDLIVDPQGITEYFVLAIGLHFPFFETWHVSGADLTRFPDSADDSSLERGVTWPLAADPRGNFFYAIRGPAQDISGPLNLAILLRNPDGSLASMTSKTVTSRSVCGTLMPFGPQIGKAVTANGNRTFLYFTCPNTSTLELTVIDNTTGAILSTDSVNVSGVPVEVNGGSNAMAIDPSGSFLLMIDTPGSTVDVYTIDAATGVPSSQPITHISTRRVPNSLVFDATGQFVYVVDSCALDFRAEPCTENGEVFAYRLDGGKMNPLPGSPFKSGGLGTSTITVVKP